MEFVNIIFFLGSILFYVLGILIFRLYRIKRITHDFFLGCFFICNGSSLPLVIFFPFNTSNANSIELILLISTCFVLVTIDFLQFFIDFAIYEKITVFTCIFSTWIGIILGILLSGLPIRLIWQKVF